MDARRRKGAPVLWDGPSNPNILHYVANIDNPHLQRRKAAPENNPIGVQCVHESGAAVASAVAVSFVLPYTPTDAPAE